MSTSVRFMPRGGRLAAWSAVLLATLPLGAPAGAQSFGQSVNQPATTVHTGDTGAPGPQPTEADPDDTAPAVEVVRYDSSDPYAMSIEMAGALVAPAGGTSEWAVLSPGESWAEAAAAGPLAASLDAPVLLVPPGGLQARTARPDLVAFLRSAGVRRVVIVGSPDVLPNHEPSVLYGLGMLPRNTERVHGTDPIGTSVAVAERMGLPAEMGELGRTVIIADDQSVADTVALGPLAAAGPFPLLLTASDALDPRIATYLTEHKVSHAVLVGGEAAVTPAVEDAVKTAGAQVTRLAGIDRYHTATLAMDLLAESPRCADEAIDNIGLVPAEEPRLALTAGRLLGPQCIPLLFTDADGLAPVSQNHMYLYRHRTGIEPAWHLIGDEVTIDPTVIERPPVRMATVADNPDGDGQHIVVLDEHHQPTRYLLDAGFDGITHVQWTADGSVISFTGIRDGMPYVYEGVRDGVWAFRETVQGGTRRTYELDLRSGTARPQSPFPSWYRRPIEDTWVDPLPSPDRKYIVFRAPAEDYARHSLFALHVDTGEVQQLTHNTTDDTHHVVSSDWLPDGRRLIYTHVTIAQLKNPVPPEFPDDPTRAYAFAEPRQFGSECGNVPQQRAHLVDVATGLANPLPHNGYLVDQPLLASPDGRFIAIKSYQDYEFAPERHIHHFFYWGCTHDGIGLPSVSVYSVSSPEPRPVTEDSLSGYDPTWSPGSNFLVFRAPTGMHAGHSLLAVDAETGNVAHITRNQSDEHHHIAQHWLSDESRLLYSVQSIELLAEPCHHLSPEQQRPFGVPHVEADIVDLQRGHSVPLEHDGLVAGSYSGSGFSLAPDGRHVSFVASPSYEPVSSQASCGYTGSGDSRFYLYDVSAPPPRPVELDGLDAFGRLWSPDGRYLPLAQHGLSRRGRPEWTYLVLDTHNGTIWRLPLSDIFETRARFDDVAWTPDGTRLLSDVDLYDFEFGDYRDTTYATVIADVEAKRIVRLAVPEELEGYLRFHGFSPDGQAVVHSDGNRSGTLRVHDTGNGALLGTYHAYAANEPGESVFDNPDDSALDNILEGFRFSAEWSPAGIFASSEHYLWSHQDY